MAKENRYPLIEVKWLDHANIAGWQKADSIDDYKPCKVTTAGFLVKEDKQALYISSSYSPDVEEVNATMLILKKCITKRKTLRK